MSLERNREDAPRPETTTPALTPPAPTTPPAGRLRVGQPLEAVLFIADLAPILGVGLKQAYHLEKLGELKRFELEAVGNRIRYSGRKVQAWLDGERLREPAPAGRQYFGKARR